MDFDLTLFSVMEPYCEKAEVYYKTVYDNQIKMALFASVKLRKTNIYSFRENSGRRQTADKLSTAQGQAHACFFSSTHVCTKVQDIYELTVFLSSFL